MSEPRLGVPVDFFGREIEWDDWIVYPVRQGSDLSFRAGRVKEIRYTGPECNRLPQLRVEKEDGGRLYTVSSLWHVFKLPQGYDIEVIEFEHGPPGHCVRDSYGKQVRQLT